MKLELNLLRMKFSMQQLSSAWSWTSAGFRRAQMLVCSLNSASYLGIPAGVQFFHCSNILLHSLMRTGVSQGFPSFPMAESNVSVSCSETAQRVFYGVISEQSKKIHLYVFKGYKATSHSVWSGQLLSEAMNGYRRCSTLLWEHPSGGSRSWLERVLCSNLCAAILAVLTMFSWYASQFWM